MSSIIPSGRIIIKWGYCATQNLVEFYQRTKVREKLKLKDGEKCIWCRIVTSNACKLSGRTLGNYIFFVFSMVKTILALDLKAQ